MYHARAIMVDEPIIQSILAFINIVFISISKWQVPKSHHDFVATHPFDLR
jgi:hypothetical protein